MIEPINNILLDRYIKHAVYLERLKTAEVRKLVTFFNDHVEPDLIAQLFRKFGSGTVTEKRLADLLDTIDEISKDASLALQKQFTDGLREIIATEAEWTTALSKKVLTPLAIDFRTPHLGILKASVINKPVYGLGLQDWFNELGKRTAMRVQQQINIGLAQGESYYHIVRRIRGTRAAGFSDGILQDSRRNIESVVRTSVASIAQFTREETYKANDDIIDKVQLVATLDSRTTEICMGYDGQTYPIGEGPRPPFHYCCRTQVVPVLKSWKSLGINLKEAPEGTRSSFNGQVPAKLTYGQWLKQQTPEFQNEALGPTRARLFREGKVTVDRFAPDGNMLTLDELRKREGLTVKDIKVKRIS